MALNDEVRIDECTSKRSQMTGHLLIVMPKLNVENAITVKNDCDGGKVQNGKDLREMKQLRGAVDIRNIVVDESEVPPLI